MPFKSKSQMRACRAKNDSRWNCDEWASQTDLKKLPEKVSSLKSLITPVEPNSDLGPYRRDAAGDMAEASSRVSGMEFNRKNRPGHYWANPFVHGPLSEVVARIQRRINAAETNYPALAPVQPVGDALAPGAGMAAQLAAAVGLGHKENRKNIESSLGKTTGKYDEEKKDKDQLKKKASKLGPFDLDRASEVMGRDRQLAMMTRNRKENFGHYMLNPFVGGPLSEALGRLSRRWSAGEGTSTPLAVMNRIPGPNLATIPASIIRGGPEKRQKLRDDYRETVDTKDKKEKEAQVNTSDLLKFAQAMGKKAAGPWDAATVGTAPRLGPRVDMPKPPVRPQQQFMTSSAMAAAPPMPPPHQFITNKMTEAGPPPGVGKPGMPNAATQRPYSMLNGQSKSQPPFGGYGAGQASNPPGKLPFGLQQGLDNQKVR